MRRRNQSKTIQPILGLILTTFDCSITLALWSLRCARKTFSIKIVPDLFNAFFSGSPENILAKIFDKIGDNKQYKCW